MTDMLCREGVLRILRTTSVLILAAGCSEADISGSHGAAPPSPLNISNSRAGLVAFRDVANSIASPPAVTTHAAHVVASASDPGSVAYVSVTAQTFPAGITAVVTNLRSHTQLSASMVDGGLDPVPLPAIDGDSVQIAIESTGSSIIGTIANVVPKRQPPHVVRTIPDRGKTGVPLNKIIEIIFSEPVSPASLSSSIELLKGNERVEGSLGILDGVTAAVVFTPASVLEANTEYQLVVTAGVRDLDGDSVDSTVTIPFTTGTTIAGAIASLDMIPEFVDVRVGNQFQFAVIAKDANGVEITGLPITWFGIDTLVVAMTNAGLVTARAEGSSLVWAQVGQYFALSSVNVSNSITAAASVRLSADSVTVDPGGTLAIAAVVRDVNGNFVEERFVKWTSTNPAIGTVAASPNNGQPPPVGSGELVTAPRSSLYWAQISGMAKGAMKVVATVDGVSDTVAVTVVSAPPVIGLAMSADTSTLLMHASTLLSALSVNSGGGRTPIPGADVQWESSNTQVLTVDAGVLATGGSPGSATITAHWSGFSATAHITVLQIQFSTLSPGRTHNCATTTNNETYCWGADDFGQLGKPGITFPAFTRAATVYYPTPTRVNALALIAVSAGGYHSCGLTAGGAAYCWGYGGEGSLGTGKFDDSWSPMPVVGGESFSEIDAGTRHTCALTATGAAYCWGSNAQGQLGARPDRAPSATPLAVGGGIVFASLSSGGTHTCGLRADGAAYCWGDNAGGQLGVGGNNVTTSPTPLPVAGGLAFASISAGESHSCGVTTDAALYCWGWNFDGQLGNGATQTASWAPVRVASNLTFTAVAAGGSHTCAIAVGGAAYCWGRNDNAQLGIGPSTQESIATPQRVGTDLIFDKLSAGRGHTCGRGADTWYCWGDNESGVLGFGSTTDSGSPVKVLGQH